MRLVYGRISLPLDLFQPVVVRHQPKVHPGSGTCGLSLTKFHTCLVDSGRQLYVTYAITAQASWSQKGEEGRARGWGRGGTGELVVHKPCWILNFILGISLLSWYSFVAPVASAADTESL